MVVAATTTVVRWRWCFATGDNGRDDGSSTSISKSDSLWLHFDYVRHWCVCPKLELVSHPMLLLLHPASFCSRYHNNKIKDSGLFLLHYLELFLVEAPFNFNLTKLSNFLGMASALETLCGQAYGAKQYDMLGVYLQRSWIVLFLTIILLLPVYIFTTPILVALGQEKNTAQVAGSIAFWSIGIIFAFAVSFTCQMFLQAQSKNKIIAYLATVSISIHVFLSWLLTVKYKFGLNGAMASIIVAHWIRNVGKLVFIMNKCPETWKGFSFAAFKDLWPVIKLSLSSGAMLCLEIWYNTVLILLTGNLENAEVAIDALTICLNINGWEMMIALGFFAAASVRVSNELGRGSSKAAKFFIVITVLTSFSIDFNLCSLQRRRMEKKLPKLKCLSILQNEKYKDRVCLIPILWQNLV